MESPQSNTEDSPQVQSYKGEEDCRALGYLIGSQYLSGLMFARTLAFSTLSFKS